MPPLSRPQVAITSLPARLRGIARSARAVTALGLVAGIIGGAPAAAQAASAPTANTLGASAVTYSSATLNGSVNPKGQATNYVFQYGTTHNYGSETPLAPAGSGTTTIKVSQAITGLAPLTTYHYRMLATSPAGATPGPERTFTTPKVPLSLAIVGVPNPVTFGSPLLVEGTLSGTEAANHEVELQANSFPYTAGFQVIGNPELTTATGAFSFPYLGLNYNAQLRVVTVGKPELVASPVILEGVAVHVSFHVSSTKRRGYARLYGTVTPAEAGSLVGFQLLRPGKSINKGGTVVKTATSSYSTFSRVVRVKPGLYKALIQVTEGAHVSAFSNPVLIR